ncbi:MAG: glycosyltransferase [Acidobacteriota bacterium]|nr:glycosyltransferase [Acidobacteriota bacterium]
MRDTGLLGDIRTARPEAKSLCGFPLSSLESTTPRPDFIYERYSLWHTAGGELATHHGVPFILEVNSPLPLEATRHRGLRQGASARKVARTLMRRADGIVCVSSEVAAWVKQQRGHGDRVWVIPNGVDPKIFSPIAARNPPADWPAGWGVLDEPIVAFAGSFKPWHGLDSLIEAFALFIQHHSPSARLLCVGDGPQREPFMSRAMELGVSSRVHITGAVSQPEVARWLARAAIAVAPYPALDDFYFSPLKLYEFLGLGIPTVAGEIGQIVDVLGAGERGWIYPAGDTAALATMLGQVLDEPLEARQRALAGLKWVLAKATWAERVREILSRIDELSSTAQRRTAP